MTRLFLSTGIVLCHLIYAIRSVEVIQPQDSFNIESNPNNPLDGCGCDSLEIISTRDTVLNKHKQLLGRYHRRIELVNDRPSYEHFSGNFFLFYNLHSQGFWAVSEKLNTDVVRLENQGDSLCPYRLKSLWRFADGDLNALVYDVSLQVVCLEDPCSVANCGHQAECVQEKIPLQPNGANNGTALYESNTRCVCNPGYEGNAYERCYPSESESECNCHRLIFSTQNSVALSKHHNSYGEYFLWGHYDGSPVYQHFAGVEYLYLRDGNWLISDEVYPLFKPVSF